MRNTKRIKERFVRYFRKSSQWIFKINDTNYRSDKCSWKTSRKAIRAFYNSMSRPPLICCQLYFSDAFEFFPLLKKQFFSDENRLNFLRHFINKFPENVLYMAHDRCKLVSFRHEIAFMHLF